MKVSTMFGSFIDRQSGIILRPNWTDGISIDIMI